MLERWRLLGQGGLCGGGVAGAARRRSGGGYRAHPGRKCPLVRYFLFLETLPRRGSQGAQNLAQRERTWYDRWIGSRSRSRSQPQYMYTILCVMSRLPLFDISPSISPTYTRDPKGPTCVPSPGAAARGAATLARRRRVSRALHGRRTRRTWRPRWRDLDLTRRTTNCQRKTRHALTTSTICKNLDPTPVRAGA